MAEILILCTDRSEGLAALCQRQLADLGFDARVRKGAGIAHDDLLAARAVLAVWAADSTADNAFRSEATFANERKCYVGVLAEAPSRVTLLPPFNLVLHHDLSGWNGAAVVPAWVSVIASLEGKLGRSGTSDYVACAHAGLLPLEGWLRTNAGHPMADRARLRLERESAALEDERRRMAEAHARAQAHSDALEAKHRAALKQQREREEKDHLRRRKQARDAETREAVAWLFVFAAIVVGGFWLYRFIFPVE